MSNTARQSIRRLSRRSPSIGIAVLAMATVAYMFIALSSAASYVVALETETGTPTGNAKQLSLGGASAGSAVMFGAGGTGGSCASPSDNRLRDQMDPNDIKKPWRKTTAELTLYFDIKALPGEYADYARQGAESWSRSECIEARVTTACPTGALCVPMTTSSLEKGSVVGTTFTGANNTYTVNARIEFYPILNTLSPAKRRMTTIHEMGHAFRLAHRATSTAIMFTPSRGENSILPDTTDIHNLRVLYGPAADTFPAIGEGPVVESSEHFY